MSDIKLFHISNNGAEELQGSSVAVEKTLQILIEKHLEQLLAIQFLASEFSTGKNHGGRIDTLGIDENHSPVIIEYKRSLNENVINQGLFYLDWLMDHKADFTLLVLKKLDQTIVDDIDWRAPRLICIAGDFTKYDEYAVQQIDRNINLIRYRRYKGDLLILEMVNAAIPIHPSESTSVIEPSVKVRNKQTEKTVSDYLEQAPPELQDLFESLRSFLEALGDDVQMTIRRYYIAFRRIKNIACVEIHPQDKKITIYVKADFSTLLLETGLTRDVRNIGHFGTGNLEITIRSSDDLERAKSLILKSYDIS